MLNESIFACIEMLHQNYLDIMSMPVKRFNDLLKWKTDIEDQRLKLMEERRN